MYLKKLFGETGFSLPEITIALGLVGGISLVTMKLVQDQSQNQTYLKARGDISKTVSVIQNAINDSEACKDLLAGKTPATGATGGSFAKLSRVRSGKEQIFLATPKATFNDYTSFYLNNGDIRLQERTGEPNMVDLHIRFRYKQRDASKWGAGGQASSSDAILDHRIPVYVTRSTPTGPIVTCKPLVTDANDDAREKFCNSLGGAGRWINTSGTGECLLNHQNMKCGWGTVPGNLSSLGGVDCIPVEQKLDLNQIFDETECQITANGFKIEQVSGKLRVRCL